MQLVNGDGSPSYRKCIDHNCEELPTGVLKGVHPRRFAIQILFCDNHESVAQVVAMRDFKGIRFQFLQDPLWLRDAQERELRSMQEQPFLRTKEG